MYQVILFFLFISTFSFAQSRNIKGLVLANGRRMSSVTLINLNSSARKISDLRGEFEMNFKPGDTLLTSFPGYSSDTTIFTNQPYFKIELIPSATSLKEVHISGKRTSAATRYGSLKSEYKEIYRKGDVKNAVVVTPVGIGVNVDKLYNALSREGKNARKLQHLLTADYENNVIDSKFSKALVTELTKLSGKELEDFMTIYRPSFKFVEHISEFDLSNYIMESLKKRNQSEHEI